MPLPPAKYFSGSDARERHEERKHAKLAIQRCRFAVADGSTLQVRRDGELVTLGSGDEITFADLVGIPELSPTAAMAKLIDGDHVYEQSPEGLRALASEGAEYRVAPGRSISTKRGVLGPGEAICAGDIHGLGELSGAKLTAAQSAQLQYLVQKGLVTHNPSASLSA